jgi:hypothetical protein
MEMKLFPSYLARILRQYRDQRRRFFRDLPILEGLRANRNWLNIKTLNVVFVTGPPPMLSHFLWAALSRPTVDWDIS